MMNGPGAMGMGMNPMMGGMNPMMGGMNPMMMGQMPMPMSQPMKMDQKPPGMFPSISKAGAVAGL